MQSVEPCPLPASSATTTVEHPRVQDELPNAQPLRKRSHRVRYHPQQRPPTLCSTVCPFFPLLLRHLGKAPRAGALHPRTRHRGRCHATSCCCERGSAGEFDGVDLGRDAAGHGSMLLVGTGLLWVRNGKRPVQRYVRRLTELLKTESDERAHGARATDGCDSRIFLHQDHHRQR
jgi:hypothetical protein